MWLPSNMPPSAPARSTSGCNVPRGSAPRRGQGRGFVRQRHMDVLGTIARRTRYTRARTLPMHHSKLKTVQATAEGVGGGHNPSPP